MDRLLPPVKYREPPAPEHGRELAMELIEKVSPALGGLVVAKMVLEQEGWGLSYASESLENSSIQSLLIPLLRGGFTVAINKHKLPDNPDARLRQEAFLVGHEIAHSFFYVERTGQPPRRIVSKQASRAEEEFCDEFGRPFSEW